MLKTYVISSLHLSGYAVAGISTVTSLVTIGDSRATVKQFLSIAHAEAFLDRYADQGLGLSRHNSKVIEFSAYRTPDELDRMAHPEFPIACVEKLNTAPETKNISQLQLVARYKKFGWVHTDLLVQGHAEDFAYVLHSTDLKNTAVIYPNGSLDRETARVGVCGKITPREGWWSPLQWEQNRIAQNEAMKIGERRVPSPIGPVAKLITLCRSKL